MWFRGQAEWIHRILAPPIPPLSSPGFTPDLPVTVIVLTFVFGSLCQRDCRFWASFTILVSACLMAKICKKQLTHLVMLPFSKCLLFCRICLLLFIFQCLRVMVILYSCSTGGSSLLGVTRPYWKQMLTSHCVLVTYMEFYYRSWQRTKPINPNHILGTRLLTCWS